MDIVKFEVDVTAELGFHDGSLWVGTDDKEGRLAYPVDPKTSEIGEPLEYYESSLGSIETDDYIFDRITEGQIAQIDKSTGETIEVLEGDRPKFVIGKNLWLDKPKFVPVAEK